MSQVISLRVDGDFKKACEIFRNEAKLTENPNENNRDSNKFLISYDASEKEISIEGDYPERLLTALLKVEELCGGDLLYEGEEWDEDRQESNNEASLLQKTGIIIMVIFFPVTLFFLLVRAIIWVPYQLWKALK